ncbi:hypothetical protein D3C81_1397530 [compost metagenome]
MNDEGELMFDIYGDLAGATGINNIKNSINQRLMTEVGELSMHQEYGTNLAALIGQNEPYVKKLAEIYLIEALRYEDRVDDVNILSLTIEGTNMNIKLELKLLSGSRVEILDVRI